jgi:hypothetical protein
VFSFLYLLDLYISPTCPSYRLQRVACKTPNTTKRSDKPNLSIRPTVTKEELHAAAKGRGFSIPAGSQEETDFLLLQNSFDAVASAVAALPEYIDPRVEPTPVEGGERKWSRPSPEKNPLNAWSHKVSGSDVFGVCAVFDSIIRQI